MRSHAGQPAFPGGAVDPGDASPTAAAATGGGRGDRPRPGRRRRRWRSCRRCGCRRAVSSSYRCWRGGVSRRRSGRSTRPSVPPSPACRSPSWSIRPTGCGCVTPTATSGRPSRSAGCWCGGSPAGLLDRLLDLGGWAGALGHAVGSRHVACRPVRQSGRINDGSQHREAGQPRRCCWPADPDGRAVLFGAQGCQRQSPRFDHHAVSPSPAVTATVDAAGNQTVTLQHDRPAPVRTVRGRSSHPGKVDRDAGQHRSVTRTRSRCPELNVNTGNIPGKQTRDDHLHGAHGAGDLRVRLRLPHVRAHGRDTDRPGVLIRWATCSTSSCVLAIVGFGLSGYRQGFVVGSGVVPRFPRRRRLGAKIAPTLLQLARARPGPAARRDQCGLRRRRSPASCC